jgi:dCTP deaminase
MLSDRQIVHLGETGVISPFEPSQVQPASYDMRLGENLRVFEPNPFGLVVDTKEAKDRTLPLTINPNSGFELYGFDLAVTSEAVHMPSNLVARVEGKSSLARLGLFVHITAGFIDPGFQGHITLELYCANGRGIVLYPGMPICQLSFQHLEQYPLATYGGKYQADGELDPDPVASRYYKNFKENGGPF